MSAPTCPYCGAEKRRDWGFECGTGPIAAWNPRSIRCRETEAARLTSERDEALDVLEKWLQKQAWGYKPGGWDYDKHGAALCMETAKLLGIRDPWVEPMPPRAKAKEAKL